MCKLLVEARAAVDGKTKVRAGYECHGVGVLADCAPAPVDVQNGWTLLHKAAYDNSVEVAELVLRAGAKVDTKGNVRAACGWHGATC